MRANTKYSASADAAATDATGVSGVTAAPLAGLIAGDLTQREWQFLAADAHRVTAAIPRFYGRAQLTTEISALVFSDTLRHSVKTCTNANTTPAAALNLSALNSLSPDFVLLHGAGLYAHSFDAVNLLLSGTRVAFDLPGHGASAWRQDADYTAGTLAQQLAPLFANLTKPITLVGHSLGGLTALLLAEIYPANIKHLVLVDITPDTLSSHASQKVAEFLSGKRIFNSVEDMVDRAIAFNIGHDRAQLTRGVTLNSRLRADGKYEWAHHFAHLPSLIGSLNSRQDTAQKLWQATANLAANNTPITLITGDKGMVSAAEINTWRKKLPASFVFELVGGHNLHEQNPAGLAQLLQQAAA